VPPGAQKRRPNTMKRHFFMRMPILIWVAAILLSCGNWCAQSAPVETPVRERISFNSNWRFIKGDPTNAGAALNYEILKPWMMSTGAEFTTNVIMRPEGNPGDNVAYVKSDFNDAAWRTLNLP